MIHFLMTLEIGDWLIPNRYARFTMEVHNYKKLVGHINFIVNIDHVKPLTIKNSSKMLVFFIILQSLFCCSAFQYLGSTIHILLAMLKANANDHATMYASTWMFIMLLVMQCLFMPANLEMIGQPGYERDCLLNLPMFM